MSEQEHGFEARDGNTRVLELDGEGFEIEAAGAAPSAAAEAGAERPAAVRGAQDDLERAYRRGDAAIFSRAELGLPLTTREAYAANDAAEARAKELRIAEYVEGGRNPVSRKIRGWRVRFGGGDVPGR